MVGFDGGTDGGFIGNALYEPLGGNPDGNAHHNGTFFFNEIRTGGVGEPVNSSFVGDYSSFAEVTFRLDVKVDSLTDFIGNQISRPFGIALFDRGIQGGSGPSGVFFEFPFLSAATVSSWTEFSVTIADPTSASLPMGWIGFGSEDPLTFEPVLPAGATFATVLAGVDEVRFTGAVPGFFFTNAGYDVRVDNVAVVVTDPSLGSELCVGAPNSTGLGADLKLTGSDVASANSLTITVQSLPLNSMGYALHSQGAGFVANPAGSQGNLCIAGAPIGRFSMQVLDSGTTGAVAFSPDLASLPTPTGSEPALAGETRYFQYWYRDLLGGVPTSNFSSAERLTFL